MPVVRRGNYSLQSFQSTFPESSTDTCLRATSIANGLDLGIALIHKERARPNEVSKMVLVGDVKDRIAIIVDDMADTCGTLVKAADVVIQHGAKGAIAIVTHGILSGNAIEALNGSKLKTVVVTNTVPHAEKKERCDRIETIDISPTVSLLPSRYCPSKAYFLLRIPSTKQCTITNKHNSLRKHVVALTMARVYLSSSSTLL